MINKADFFPEGFRPLVVKVNTSSFKKSWKPADYGVPVHVSRTVGTTGNFKTIGDEFGLELRSIRETLYSNISNIGLKVSDNLWAIPGEENWDKAMHYVQRATNDMKTIKSKLRGCYPQAIDEYADFAERHLEGLGDLVRRNAHSWDYLEERLQVIVYTNYEASAKTQVYEGISERVSHCLNALSKPGGYKISKYTADQLQSIIDWCSAMSAYEASLMSIAITLEKMKELVPEKVKTKEPYSEISNEIAECLLSIQTQVLAHTSDVETTMVVNSSVPLTKPETLPTSSKSGDSELFSKDEKEALIDLFG